MRLRALTEICAPWGSHHTGDLFEIDDEMAAKLVEVGAAERVESAAPAVVLVVESAALEPPERAVQPPGRKRRG